MLCLSLALGFTGAKDAKAETIHDVVSATWPAPLVPIAEQINYHEGGGIVNDGYCGWGMLPSTQAMLGMSYSADPYYCSAQAYRLYRIMGGFSPWVTYGYYEPRVQFTQVSYY